MTTLKTRTLSLALGTALLAGIFVGGALPASATELDSPAQVAAAVVTTNDEPAPWSRGRAGAWTLVFGGAAVGMAAVGSYAFSRTQRRAAARA